MPTPKERARATWRHSWRPRQSPPIAHRIRDRYTLREIGRIVGVPHYSVRRWIAKGWLTASRPKPRLVLVRKLALRRALSRPEVQLSIAKHRALIA